MKIFGITLPFTRVADEIIIDPVLDYQTVKDAVSAIDRALWSELGAISGGGPVYEGARLEKTYDLANGYEIYVKLGTFDGPIKTSAEFRASVGRYYQSERGRDLSRHKDFVITARDLIDDSKREEILQRFVERAKPEHVPGLRAWERW